jgi:hypothetical protein
MKGSNIYEVDTIRGCDNECLECYALKGAAKSQITHNKVVQATLKGKLPLDGISRFGVVGDAAADWAWSVDQVRQALERTPGATAQKNVMAVTKLQSIEGFDPKVFPNLEISLDPIFPASMKKTMENALLLKTQHPEMNIAFRIRTLQSNSDDLMKSQKLAEDFVKTLDAQMLETRMRFVRNSTLEALELDMGKYHRVGNQFKLKNPVLDPSYKGYELCDSALVGCEGCNACSRLVQKTFGQGPGKPLSPKQVGAAIALLEASNLGMGNEER